MKKKSLLSLFGLENRDPYGLLQPKYVGSITY